MHIDRLTDLHDHSPSDPSAVIEELETKLPLIRLMRRRKLDEVPPLVRACVSHSARALTDLYVGDTDPIDPHFNDLFSTVPRLERPETKLDLTRSWGAQVEP